MPKAEPRHRDAITDQLAYLIDELEAQQVVFGMIPDGVRTTRPFEGERTLLEMYGRMVAREEQLHASALSQFDAPLVFDASDDRLTDEDWNAMGLEAVTQRWMQARRLLVQTLRALPDAAWERASLAEYTYRMTQDDVDALRDIGLRLHDSQLGSVRVPRLG